MKIAIFHSFYSTGQPSGENNVVMDQIVELTRAGHEVQIFAKRTDEEEAKRLYRLKSAIRVATGIDSRPLDFLTNFNPDIVHIHNLFPNIGISWLRDWTGPIVVSIHNYRPICSKGTLYRDSKICTLCPNQGELNAIRHACYRDSLTATIPLAVSRNQYQLQVLERADAVIMTSEGSATVFSELSRRKMHIELIPNFGYGSATRPLPSKERLERGWIALGRLSPEKGFLELVQSWPEEYKLTLIGSGQQQQLIESVIADSTITFIPDLPRDELRTQLPTFAGLILPSRWLEIAPQVVVESMRVGLPVIAYDSNTVSNLVELSQTGLSYKDHGSLRLALFTVEGKLSVFSQNAVNHYNQFWTPEAWITKIERLYSNLI